MQKKLRAITAVLQSIPETATCWLGLSGGVDSLVLLHLLKHQSDLLQGRVLRAVYIDHGLQIDSAQWAQHCAEICQAWDVPFTTTRLTLDTDTGESIEALARNARYAYCESLLEAGDALLTAHHQDDQAETLLLQLLRGAGVQGLSAMPKIKVFGKGYLARPLLDVSREEILAYAQTHELSWIDDPSNTDLRFDRNFLRQQIMPLLKQRWPHAAKTISRSAKHCADTWGIAESHIADVFQTVTGSQANTLSIKKVLNLSASIRPEIIRYWLRQLELSVPTALQLQQLEQDVLRCSQNADPEFRFADVMIRRYRDDLYVGDRVHQN